MRTGVHICRTDTRINSRNMRLFHVFLFKFFLDPREQIRRFILVFYCIFFRKVWIAQDEAALTKSRLFDKRTRQMKPSKIRDRSFRTSYYLFSTFWNIARFNYWSYRVTKAYKNTSPISGTLSQLVCPNGLRIRTKPTCT